jgi:hypothetical protein
MPSRMVLLRRCSAPVVVAPCRVSCKPSARRLSGVATHQRRLLCPSGGQPFSSSTLESSERSGSGRGQAAGEKPGRHHQRMPDEQFDFMQRVISAPSPVGLEAAMTQGVIAPYFQSFGATRQRWTQHTFVGNAGTVWDTEPSGEDAEGKLTVMFCGHADKIRMQVRSISEDGKVWINSDSFLPLTLLGNHVTLFSEDPQALGSYRYLPWPPHSSTECPSPVLVHMSPHV